MAVAVGLFGGWLLSLRWQRQVAAIAAAASRIAAGQVNERLDAGRADADVRELALALNAAFDRLGTAAQRQSRFTSDASHELRTPLAIIRSQAELALSRPRRAVDYRSALEDTLHSAERMTELLERLLMLARMDAGGQGLHRKVVLLDRVVSGAAAQLAPLAVERGVTVALDLDPCAAIGDATVLAQVAVNLIHNAIKYNRPSGGVRVKLRRVRNTVTLAVIEGGPGIPLQHQPHLFERFYRAERGRSRASGGCGLGLALCKAIVEAHGGEMGFESVPGQGSTFWAKLPATDDPAATLRPRSPRTGDERLHPAAWTTSTGAVRVLALQKGSAVAPTV